MSSINLHTREINVKMVYYGPGLGGKTTSLQFIHRALPEANRGEMVSLATSVDRTLFFDFLPVRLTEIRGFTIRMSLYTVPGQVHYNATRKLVLQGADGVVFVADSQEARRIANIESLQNLQENLRGHGMNPDSVPLVLQYNKRDLSGVMSTEELDADLRFRDVPRLETCALDGRGIFSGLKAITRLVLTDLKQKGVYEDRPRERPAPEFEPPPVVNPTVEQTLVRALETRTDLQPVVVADDRARPATAPEAAPPGPRGLTFSELWEPGDGSEQILALESEIGRGEYAAAVRRGEGLLHDALGAGAKDGAPLAEKLLLLGVHGPHYARLMASLERPEPTKTDALFWLFFLTDVALRLRC